MAGALEVRIDPLYGRRVYRNIPKLIALAVHGQVQHAAAYLQVAHRQRTISHIADCDTAEPRGAHDHNSL